MYSQCKDEQEVLAAQEEYLNREDESEEDGEDEFTSRNPNHAKYELESDEEEEDSDIEYITDKFGNSVKISKSEDTSVNR